MRTSTPVARLPSNDDARHGGVVDDREIGTRAHRRIEIADRRRGALLGPVAHRHRAVAVAEVRVHVGDERDLVLLRVDVHGLGQRRPVVRLGAADRHRAVLAVLLAAEIEIAFELAEERQHVVPAPAGRAQRLPLGVVVGRAAIGDHAHHGRAAAHDAALREAGERRVVLAPPVHLQAGPEIRVVVVGRRIGIEHVGRLLAGRRVRPGFEQQHVAARDRRQPVGEHAARRAAAHDDGVVALGHGGCDVPDVAAHAEGSAIEARRQRRRKVPIGGRMGRLCAPHFWPDGFDARGPLATLQRSRAAARSFLQVR